jgi:DNA-binding transcriptional LysR family regulator
MSPDLNKLGHFVAVAESLNFTRAAGRLHMTQQALSSSIRRLEQELEVQLFVRSTRHVTLTDAGRHLLQEGRPLLASSQATWDSVRRIDRGEPALVRVGHTPPVPREQLDAYIIAWRVSSPTSGIVITQHWIGGLVRGVADGELDVGLCRVIEPEPGLVLTTLGQRPLRVAMAVGHPFATRRSLGLADLAEERILESDLADPRSQQYHEFFVGLCRGAGFEPTLVPTPV